MVSLTEPPTGGAGAPHSLQYIFGMLHVNQQMYVYLYMFCPQEEQARRARLAKEAEDNPERALVTVPEAGAPAQGKWYSHMTNG